MSDDFEDMTGAYCKDCGGEDIRCFDCATEPLEARIAELEAELARSGSSDSGTTPADAIEWLQDQLTLHNGVEFTYVVDGYTVDLTEHDGATTYVAAHGPTLAEAIANARRRKARLRPEPSSVAPPAVSETDQTPAAAWENYALHLEWCKECQSQPLGLCALGSELKTQARYPERFRVTSRGTIERADDVIQVATESGHIVSVVGSVSREQRGEK